MSMVSVSLSALDQERFGVKVAKAKLFEIGDIPNLISFCELNAVNLAIVRCPSTELRIVQTLEKEGFFLADTLVYYRRNLTKSPIPEDTSAVAIRFVQPGDEEHVAVLAAESFRGYYGHYHADPWLDPAKCDEVYVDWAVRSCSSKDVADEVLIAEDNARIVGFATMRLNTADEGEGVLFGVAPAAQGKGIYRSFIIQGMLWCERRGAKSMVVSTQVTNIAVQKVWVRLGFEPSHSYYTLHSWFGRYG